MAESGADLDSLLGPSMTNTLLTFSALTAPWNVTPDDLYPATIYTLDGDGVADFQQDFTAGGLLDALYNLFTTHAEYLGLTPTQIADATTSTDGDLTNHRHLRQHQQLRRVDWCIRATGSAAADCSRAYSSPCNCI